MSPDLLAHSLRQPTSSIAYAIGQQVATLFAGEAIVESGSYFFDLQEFAADGHCRHSTRRRLTALYSA